MRGWKLLQFVTTECLTLVPHRKGAKEGIQNWAREDPEWQFTRQLSPVVGSMRGDIQLLIPYFPLRLCGERVSPYSFRLLAFQCISRLEISAGLKWQYACSNA